jgi:hypothetical protein
MLEKRVNVVIFRRSNSVSAYRRRKGRRDCRETLRARAMVTWGWNG